MAGLEWKASETLTPSVEVPSPAVDYLVVAEG